MHRGGHWKWRSRIFFQSLPCLVASVLLTFAAAGDSRSIEFPLDVHPPRAVTDPSLDHRGFPSRVTLYEFEDAPALSAAEHLRWHGLRLLCRDRAWRQQRLQSPSVRTSRVSYTADLLGGITRVGEYYTKIEVGGQKVRVQVDTGSATLALPMAECKNCLPSDLRYNIRRSKNPDAHIVSCTNERCAPDMCAAHRCKRCSAKDACCSEEDPAGCGFSLKYGDGSFAKGALVVDTLTWGSDIDSKNKNGTLSAEVVFGGILSDSRRFERPIVDGIMGFAYEALACNPTCVEPPFQQLVKAGVVKDKFAICMTPRGGKLALGDVDPKLANGPISYVPLALSRIPTFYTVNISSQLTIGKGSVNLPDFRNGVVDSGTTLIAVTLVTFKLILQYMREHYCHVPHMCDPTPWFMPASCVIMSDDILEMMPTLVFHLGVEGARFDLELRPQDYMVGHEENGVQRRCVGFMALRSLPRGTDIIFGNTIMLRYLTIYDRENKRMGFAESSKTCGAPPICSDYTQCRECAAEPQCAFNFATKKCLAASKAGHSLFSFPVCHGSRCPCGLGQQAYFVYGLGTGFASCLAIVGALAAFVSLFVVRGRAGSSPVAGLPIPGSGRGASHANGEEPLPLVENEKI